MLACSGHLKNFFPIVLRLDELIDSAVPHLNLVVGSDVPHFEPDILCALAPEEPAYAESTLACDFEVHSSIENNLLDVPRFEVGAVCEVEIQYLIEDMSKVPCLGVNAVGGESALVIVAGAHEQYRRVVDTDLGAAVEEAKQIFAAVVSPPVLCASAVADLYDGLGSVGDELSGVPNTVCDVEIQLCLEVEAVCGESACAVVSSFVSGDSAVVVLQSGSELECDVEVQHSIENNMLRVPCIEVDAVCDFEIQPLIDNLTKAFKLC